MSTSAADGPRHRARRVATREGLLYVLKVFVAVRLGLALIAVLGTALLPPLHAVSVPGWPAPPAAPGWHNLFTAWERFDALWYLRIAAHGYANHDGSAAFFPLYPLLVRAVSFALGNHPYAASLVVSNLAFLAGLAVLYAFTREEESEGVARRAVLYAAVFPTALFFVAPYSESLFLLLALVTLWAARRGRWAAAGLAGALAALTRNLGLLLVLPLAVEAVQQGRGRPRASALAWSAAPAAGTLAYLWYWRAISGDWLAPLHQQSGWQRTWSFPLATLWHATQDFWRYAGLYPGGYHQLDWVIVVPALAAGVYAAVRFRPLYGVYTWASFLAPLCLVFAPRPLMSFPRFVLPVFPVYWAFARWTEGRRTAHELLVACSAALLGVLTLLFVNWYYVF